MKTYLVEVRTAKKGDRILPGGTTEAEWDYTTYDGGWNSRLVYPVMVGEMTEDDNGNVEYVYY